jgi:hypothetical protein
MNNENISVQLEKIPHNENSMEMQQKYTKGIKVGT